MVQTITSIIVIIGIFVINIINYILLDSLFQIHELREREHLLQQQILFQENKYNQISTTYRNTRKILHETQRHYHYVQECAEQKNYDMIQQFLSTAISDLEHCFNRINTGSLVIDSFVSSHLTMAEHEHIQYETNIQVTAERIPVDEYTLCILLGNLLDNSMQECRRILPPHSRFIQVEIFTLDTEFVLHVVNSTRIRTCEDEKNDLEYQLYHGYGLENVKTITDHFNGTYVFSQEGNVYNAVIIIPIMQ